MAKIFQPAGHHGVEEVYVGIEPAMHCFLHHVSHLLLESSVLIWH